MELERMYKEPEITFVIKFHQLRWLGHIVRIERNRMAKIELRGATIGKKKDGRSRERRCEGVDLRDINIRYWK